MTKKVALHSIERVVGNESHVINPGDVYDFPENELKRLVDIDAVRDLTDDEATLDAARSGDKPAGKKAKGEPKLDDL